MAVPGCVFLEANVVTADGKRVPKKHSWEPRVFFQGGACVEREAIRGGTEPADLSARGMCETGKVFGEARLVPDADNGAMALCLDKAP